MAQYVFTTSAENRRYLLENVSAGGAGINETVLHFLASRSVLSLAAGWFVATACSASANFVGMKLLVFRGQRKGEPHQTRGADPSSDS